MPGSRPTGVTLAAVLAIAGSVVLILFGALMAVTTQLPPQPDARSFVKPILFVLCIVMLGFAAWGISTAIGLFRLQSWSRWSMLTFASLLTCFCSVAALSTALIPFPPTPGAPAGLMAAVKLGLIVFYLVLALLGGFWLFYFNRAVVRESFGTEAAVAGPGGRPLSVSIIAWLLLIGGGVGCVVCVLLSFPAVILTLTFQGWPARIYYLGFGVIEVWLGIGLLGLKPLSRILTIVFFTFGLVNALLYIVLPGFQERMRDSLAALPPSLRQASQPSALSGTAAGMIAGVLACAIPIAFLIRNREAFFREPSNSSSASEQS